MTVETHLREPVSDYLLTVDDLWRMTEAGVFDRDGGDRVELVGGRLIRMAPIGQEHGEVRATLIAFLHGLLTSTGLDATHRVSTATVELNAREALTPDAAVVLKNAADRYIPSDRAPLVVEVARSSLPRDLGEKQAAYAGAAIPEYWVVDVAGRVVHVFREPSVDGYARREVLKGEDLFRPQFANGAALGSVKDLF